MRPDRRSAYLRRVLCLMLAWLAGQPGLSWAAAAPHPVETGTVSGPCFRVLELDRTALEWRQGICVQPNRIPGVPGTHLGDDVALSDSKVGSDVIRVEESGLRLLPGWTAKLELPGADAGPPPTAATTVPRTSLLGLSQLGLVRLELQGIPDRWEAGPPSDSPQFRDDTSFSQKGSVDMADGVWNRVGIQFSRVDVTTGGRITYFGELMHQSQQLPYSLPGDTPETEPPQPLSIGFTQTGQWGSAQRWEYGLQYRSLDPRFEKLAGADLKKDEASAETWVGWRSGPLRLRGFASQARNNVAEDPNQDRTTQLLGGGGVELELPSSTWLTLSYARGTSDRSRDFVTGSQRRRLGEVPEATSSSVEKMRTGIYHWRGEWDLSLSASYAPGQDADSRSQDSLSQDLAVTLRPTKKLGSTLVMSLWQVREEWTGYRAEGGNTSLSFWYGPFLEGHTVVLWGSYDRGRSNDGYWDSQSVYSSATLSRRLGRTSLGQAWLSVETGYNVYRDAVRPTSSLDEVYGKVTLKLIAF